MNIFTRWLFLLIVFYQFAYSQSKVIPATEREINLEVINEPVSQVFKKIEKQLSLHFAYNSELINGTRLITISFKKKKLDEVITLLFDDKIQCKIKNNNIILYANTKVKQVVVTKRSLINDHSTPANAEKKLMPPDKVEEKNIQIKRSDVPFAKDSAASHVQAADDSVLIQDSISNSPVPLLLINNDSTLLLQEEDTLISPK